VTFSGFLEQKGGFAVFFDLYVDPFSMGINLEKVDPQTFALDAIADGHAEKTKKLTSWYLGFASGLASSILRDKASIELVAQPGRISSSLKDAWTTLADGPSISQAVAQASSNATSLPSTHYKNETVASGKDDPVAALRQNAPAGQERNNSANPGNTAADVDLKVEKQRQLDNWIKEQSKFSQNATTKTDQGRGSASSKDTELATLLELARARDAQRQLEEARSQQQLKAAEDARLKAESEARAREQEKILAEYNAKERERQLIESRDAELAALKAQVDKLKLAAQSAGTAPISKRKALIIGNDSYRFISKLSNAREDAKAISHNLAKVGFSVTLKTDLTEKEMKAAIRIFKSQVEPGDEVAIFYAGHGIQLENTNYLIPIDVAGEGPEQVKDEAIPLQRVLDDMSDRKAKLTLALIDACRDNPFKASGRSIGQGRGLAPTSAATGQMVVFSAGTGQQALDNLGPSDPEKNGIFTRVFIREMLKPDRTVDTVVRQVRTEVVRIAKSVGHEQVPAIYDQVVGEYYFVRSAP